MAAGRMLLLLLLLHLVSLVVASTEPQVTNCFAPHTAGPQNSSLCTVPHHHHARFYCPTNVTNANWWHFDVFNHSIETLICNGPVCELHYDLGYPDSGVYRCKIPTNESFALYYYLNVTVLAPPYLQYQESCPPGSCCERPAQVVQSDSGQFSIIVYFVGVGNFSVKWTLNGSRIDCSGVSPCSLEKHEYSQTLTIYSQGHRFNQSNGGVYVANVTDDYGYNCSQTEVTIRCEFPSPSHQKKTETKKITQGQSNVMIECDEEMDISHSITVCYAPNGEELDSLNHTESCVVCPAYSSGECDGSFSSRPSWYVLRDSYQHYYCEPHQRASLVIPHVRKDDDGGKVYCAWSASTEKSVFTVYTLLVQHAVSHVAYVGGGAGAGGVILLLAVAIGIVIGCCVKKRRKPYQQMVGILDHDQMESHQQEQEERGEVEGNQQERRERRERPPLHPEGLSTSEESLFHPKPNGQPQSFNPVETISHMEDGPRMDFLVDRTPQSLGYSYGTFHRSESTYSGLDSVSLRSKPTDECATVHLQ